MTHNIIPKIIFQTWKSKTEFPDNFKYWMKTWKEKNKNYEYKLYDDNDNRNFIQTHFPWFLEQYDSYPRNIQRVDVVRYFYLYHHGGIYADMDFECLKSFNDLIMDTEYDVILGRMGNDVNFEHSIPNAIMISKPKEEFWIYVICCLYQIDKQLPTELTTGPILLKTAYDKYQSNYEQCKLDIDKIKHLFQHNVDNKSKIEVRKGEDLYPVNWLEEKSNPKYRLRVVGKGEIFTKTFVKKNFPNSYAVTYWTHSWDDQL